MSKPTKWHFRYLAHEDEAQMTGVTFILRDNDMVEVTNTYHFEEYERPGMLFPKEAARKIYAKLLADPDYELQK